MGSGPIWGTKTGFLEPKVGYLAQSWYGGVTIWYDRLCLLPKKGFTCSEEWMGDGKRKNLGDRRRGGNWGWYVK